jgi:ABC-type uncharacterized transport system ATPase subunit
VSDNPLQGTRLTPKGLAVCDFLFRDAPAAGMTDEEANKVVLKLAERISFVYGNLALHNPNVTKDDIRRAAERIRLMDR